MKKHIINYSRREGYILFFLAIIFIGITSCKSKEITPENKVRMTIEKFFSCAAQSKTDSALLIYPDCVFYDKIHIGKISILSIEPCGDDGLYKVVCNNSHYNDNGELVNSSIHFTVETEIYKDQEIQRINDSNGLLQLPASLMTFLRKTGAIGGNNDAEIADEFSAYLDFVDFSIKKYQMDIDMLAEQKYTGNEYTQYLFEHPHINGHKKLQPIE